MTTSVPSVPTSGDNDVMKGVKRRSGSPTLLLLQEIVKKEIAKKIIRKNLIIEDGSGCTFFFIVFNGFVDKLIVIG